VLARAPATAKINLALLVGPRRADGLHPVVSVMQRLALADRISVQPSDALEVHGFPQDTLVRRALTALAERAGCAPHWQVEIGKRIPVAAGLGGGSSDAATALRLANTTLPAPLPDEELAGLAATIGADVPFFLTSGPQLARGTGTELTALRLPADYWVFVLLPHDASKATTGSVYDAYDATGREAGFDERAAELLSQLGRIERAHDLAGLPPNDLAVSPHSDRLRELGAFRAEVSGAGPAVYGLFHTREAAEAARAASKRAGRTWITVPAWYG
jgi:4-diphosphocytidyl-2-C-methyl-D-erythritol kinase